MNFVVGLLILLVAFGAIYFMAKQGMFSPLTGLFSAIDQGFDPSYSGTDSSVSRYAGEAKIRFVSLGGIGGLQEIDIVAHPKNGGFNVSGWSVVTNNGKFVIPKAENLYSPSTKDVPPEDIFMRDGDRLAIYSGASPVKRNERVTQSEYHVWFENMLAIPHGKITLKDQKGYVVDQYSY